MYNSIIVLIFEAEFTESVLDKVLYLESTIRPTLVGPEENFLNEGSQMAGKCCIEIGSCKFSVS